MKSKKNNFVHDDDGAITVDWVVLCAGIAAMAVAISLGVSNKTLELGGMVTTYLTDKTPE